jgi:hypothetical protein
VPSLDTVPKSYQFLYQWFGFTLAESAAMGKRQIYDRLTAFLKPINS